MQMNRPLAVAALSALSLFTAPAFAQAPSKSDAALPQVLATPGEGTQLVLKYGTFDPLVAQPFVPPALQAGDECRLWVVQFLGLPTEAGRAAVQAAGAEVHGYLPHNAYVVRMAKNVALQVVGLPAVRCVGYYQPAWRLDPALLQDLAGKKMPNARKYNVVLVDKHRDKPNLAAKVQALGGRVVDLLEGSLLSVVELDGAQLLAAARLDEVLWIDRWSAPEEDMNNARIQGGANYVETMGGFTGQGVRGSIYEGVEYNHPDFTTPMTNVLSGGGADTHGHCTAGIVFGNGTSNPLARGMAPDAVGFYTQYSSTTSSRNTTIGVLVNTYNCMFTTASWGDALTTQYTSVSADADDIIFDHRIPWTQSQSNAGSQQSRPQAWAKNIFSIGGVEHFDNSNPGDDSWAAGGGSTGPAADGRIKPDLCAYYDAILCSDRSGSAGYSANDWYASFGGTSGATPICAGHNAIAIQMYASGLFGNPLPVPGGTTFQNRPLAQTLKALQIANAQQYSFTASSTDNRREHCGWGFPSLRNMYDNRARMYIVSETDALSQGYGRQHTLTVGPGEPELKICMTFVDPAGNPASSLARVNDLSLRVTAPNGVVYWGDNGLISGNYSTSGGSANTVDTVECVFVQNPQAGVWQVDVIATLVAADANLGTPQNDATYALCCVGGTGQVGGLLTYATAASFGTGCSAPATPSVPRTFYEVFTTGNFDLANTSMRFVPTSSGWNVVPCSNCFITTYANGLNLGDDQLSRGHQLGFSFPLAGGGSTTAIDIDSNGWIGLVTGQHAGTDYTETVSEFLTNPARIAAMWDDLNPSANGDAYFDTYPGMAVITWAGVPEYSNTGSNTAQIQLFPNGEFVLAYQGMTIGDCMVGSSVGNGVADPGASDISNPSQSVPLALAANGTPRFGTTLSMVTSDYPAGSVLGVQVLSFTSYNPGLDLSSFGMPGCRRYTDLDVIAAMLPVGTQSSYGLTVPNNPALNGLTLAAQSYSFSPGANAAGILGSNGMTLILGN